MNHFDFDYPRVRQSLGVAALRDAYPTLLLDLDGNIRGVNPLVLWLWGAIQPSEQFHPERMLGINFFTLLARNIDRIPVGQNREFYIKRSAIVKRQDEQSQRTTYAPFIAAMHSDPARFSLYEAAPLYPDRGWEWPLCIAHPQDAGVMLDFVVSSYRLSDDNGFLSVYYPINSTVSVIEECNSTLIERLGKVITVQASSQKPDLPEKMLNDTSYHRSFRDYYPRIIQDALWYLSGENRAHRLMLGMSVVGMHFFELFLAPLMRYFLGAIQESTAPRALKYFDTFTTPYMREGHELHEQYEQTMQRLAQLDAFNIMLERSRRWRIHLNSAANLHLMAGSDEPFNTCRVILPWRYDPDIHLQFKLMMRFIYPQAIVIQPDIHTCEQTFVPENDETDVALMLLPLLEPGGINDAPLVQQYLWLLTLLKVVEEGRSSSESDENWTPEDAFLRANQRLALRYSSAADVSKNALITEIQATIEALDRDKKIEREKLLILLHSYMRTQPPLHALSDFLKIELDVESQSRG